METCFAPMADAELVSIVNPNQYRDAFMKGLSFHQLSLGTGHRYGTASKNTLVKAGKACSELAERGVLGVPKLTQLSLNETGRNLKEMLKRRTVGKLVIVFD